MEKETELEIDWDDIQYAWTNGNATLQDKAIQYEINVSDILLYAKTNGWGKRGSGYVKIDIENPDQMIKDLTVSNLAAMALMLDKTLSPKDHFDLQKTIQMAKETLGVEGALGNSSKGTMSREELIELAKDRGLPVTIFV